MMNMLTRRYENRLYKEWAGIHHRCKRPGASHYQNYGGRGILICEEWGGKEGFVNFAKWALHNGYHDNLEIDRVDTDGNYSPDNCRWVTHKENCRNRNTYRGAVKALIATSADENIIGVNFRKDRNGVSGKWRAVIMVDGRNISLGHYKHKEDAIRARIDAEEIHWGR